MGTVHLTATDNLHRVMESDAVHSRGPGSQARTDYSVTGPHRATPGLVGGEEGPRRGMRSSAREGGQAGEPQGWAAPGRDASPARAGPIRATRGQEKPPATSLVGWWLLLISQTTCGSHVFGERPLTTQQAPPRSLVTLWSQFSVFLPALATVREGWETCLSTTVNLTTDTPRSPCWMEGQRKDGRKSQYPEFPRWPRVTGAPAISLVPQHACPGGNSRGGEQEVMASTQGGRAKDRLVPRWGHTPFSWSTNTGSPCPLCQVGVHHVQPLSSSESGGEAGSQPGRQNVQAERRPGGWPRPPDCPQPWEALGTARSPRVAAPCEQGYPHASRTAPPSVPHLHRG